MSEDTAVATKTIYLMDGSSSYDEEEVTCETVKCLRESKGIPATASINVNKRKANDDTLLEDGDFISVARTNKSGGKQ